MDDDGKARGGSDLELAAKRLLLCPEIWCWSRKVEPRFSNANRSQSFDRSPQVSTRRGVVLPRNLWMQAKCEINVWVTFAQCARGLPPIGRISDIHEMAHADGARGPDDSVPIKVEHRIVQMGVRVDDRRRSRRLGHFTVTLFARLRGRSGSFPRARAVKYPRS